MTFTYYFLVGQAIAYLGVSWKITFVITGCIFFIIELFHSIRALQPVMLFPGWISGFYLSEFIVQSITTTFTFTVPTQTLILAYAAEVLVFSMISVLILPNDSHPVFWAVLLIVHLFYVFVLSKVNLVFNRIKHNEANIINFFNAYMILLIITDVTFTICSIIQYHADISWQIVLISTPIITVISFFVYEYLKKTQLFLPQSEYFEESE